MATSEIVFIRYFLLCSLGCCRLPLLDFAEVPAGRLQFTATHSWIASWLILPADPWSIECSQASQLELRWPTKAKNCTAIDYWKANPCFCFADLSLKFSPPYQNFRPKMWSSARRISPSWRDMFRTSFSHRRILHNYVSKRGKLR